LYSAVLFIILHSKNNCTYEHKPISVILISLKRDVTMCGYSCSDVYDAICACKAKPMKKNGRLWATDTNVF